MGYHMLPSGYSGLQQVTACNRVVTVGYRMVTEVYRVVTLGYNRLQRVVTVGYSRLKQVTEWLQWVTAGYCRLPKGTVG